ncbi:MAG: aldo/keto reductase [Anaerolineales bacterium]|nr:aldo/keto reductase [Anaerolineales bacterium]
MKQRPLGKTDLTIGEVGLGCWQFGGDFGPMDEDTAFDIMNAAVEGGTTFFDTADVYGAGRSEHLIGRFLRNSDQRMFVATKFGRGPDVYPDKYTENELRRGTEASLKRLGVEVLDLIQLHCIPVEALVEGAVFEWLRALKAEGKIRHFGASVETVEEGLLCLNAEGITSLQIIFNIFRQKPIEELLPSAKEKGVGIIVRLPLASGLLSGKFTKRTRFQKTDHRFYNRDGQLFNVGETFAGIPFEKGIKLTDGLKEFVPEGMSIIQMSLRWILDHEAVSVMIPGASSPSQAAMNAQISDLPPLPNGLHKKLSEFYAQNVRDHIRGPY